MAKAEITKEFDVSADKFFQAVTALESYPKFVEGMKAVRAERKGDGQIRAHYELSMMSKDFQYTLDLVEDHKNYKLSWTLVEGNLFKKSDGFWSIKSLGPKKCEVTYGVDVDFSISIPSFLLSTLVKGSLPKMLDGFYEYAKKLK